MTAEAEKAGRYARVLEQARGLVERVPDPVARMSTVAALLHHKMTGFSWTGFYLLDGDTLVVGPYQGLVACLVLQKPNGVCWAAVERDETVVVPDVHAFPGHIACDARSRSEIVAPVRRPDGTVVGVLDVDSTRQAWFDEEDARGLEPFAALAFGSPA